MERCVYGCRAARGLEFHELKTGQPQVYPYGTKETWLEIWVKTFRRIKAVSSLNSCFCPSCPRTVRRPWTQRLIFLSIQHLDPPTFTLTCSKNLTSQFHHPQTHAMLALLFRLCIARRMSEIDRLNTFGKHFDIFGAWVLLATVLGWLFESFIAAKTLATGLRGPKQILGTASPKFSTLSCLYLSQMWSAKDNLLQAVFILFDFFGLCIYFRCRILMRFKQGCRAKGRSMLTDDQTRHEGEHCGPGDFALGLLVASTRWQTQAECWAHQRTARFANKNQSHNSTHQRDRLFGNGMTKSPRKRHFVVSNFPKLDTYSLKKYKTKVFYIQKWFLILFLFLKCSILFFLFGSFDRIRLQNSTPLCQFFQYSSSRVYFETNKT